MKLIKFLLLGVIFGIVITKSEALSWYRIQEMFRFQSFHMYGIIGTAVILGAIMIFLIKKLKLKDFDGNPIIFEPKKYSFPRYFIGGIIFGLGWALSGACPGPMVINIGYGYFSMIVVFIAAVYGTYIYSLIQDKLPH